MSLDGCALGAVAVGLVSLMLRYLVGLSGWVVMLVLVGAVVLLFCASVLIEQRQLRAQQLTQHAEQQEDATWWEEDGL